MKSLFSVKLAFIGLAITICAAFGAVGVFSFAASGQAPLFKENLIITSPSHSYTYNGSDFTVDCSEVTLSEESGQLSPGDYIAVEPREETYFRAGTYKNKGSYKIYDFNGQEVTRDYNIENAWGEINIKQRIIELSVNTDAVNVDTIQNGQTLTEDQLIISGDGVAETDTLTATVNKKETGDAYQFTYKFKVFNEVKNVDVTDCYATKIDINFSNRPDINIPPLEEWPDLDGINLPPLDGDIDDSLKDLFKDLPTGDQIKAPIFAMNADKAGKYYIRALSFGDYYSNDFSNVEPYTKGTYSPLEFSTANLKSDDTKAVVSLLLADGINPSDFDLMPNYTESKTKQADDISYHVDKEDGNKYHATCYLPQEINLNSIQNNYISDSQMRQEEKNYQTWVDNNYREVRSQQERYLQDFIDNYLTDSQDSLQSFATGLKEVFLRDFQFDLLAEFDQYQDLASSFLTSTKRGHFLHFSVAGSLLLRQFGYPSRVVSGFRVDYTNANEALPVTLMNLYVWSEVYIDGFGWVAIDFSPSIAYEPPLSEEDSKEIAKNDPNSTNIGSGETTEFDALPPEKDYLFTVQVSEPGDYYLREANYGDFNGKGFSDAYIYDVNDNLNPNYFFGTQLKNSGLPTRTVTVNYKEGEARTKDLVSSYYFGEGDPTANNDIYYAAKLENGSPVTTSTMTDIAYDYGTDPNYLNNLSFGNNENYKEMEETYHDGHALTKYTNIPMEFDHALDEAIEKYFPIIPSDTQLIVQLIIRYFNQLEITYNPEPDYDYEFQPSETIEEFFTKNNIECDSSIIAAAATILLRHFDIPTRLVKGYLYEAKDTSLAAITQVNEYYWNEVYFRGHGWVTIDFPKAGGIRDTTSSYYGKKTKIKITTEDVIKVYDGEEISYEPTYEILEGEVNPRHEIFVDKNVYVSDVGDGIATADYYVRDIDTGEDVSYQYALITDFGKFSITECEITIYTKSIEVPYEKGKVLSSEISRIDGLDQTKFEIKFTSLATLNSVGSVEAQIRVDAIYDENGENVMDNFKINIVPGVLQMY